MFLLNIEGLKHTTWIYNKRMKSSRFDKNALIKRYNYLM